MGREPISSALFDEARLAYDQLADFRCEVCTCRYPFEELVIQDGAKVCRANCAYDRAPSEREFLAADAKREAAEATAKAIEGAARLNAKAAIWSLMDGVAAVTQIQSGSTIYPTAISFAFGGASHSVTLTGIGFTSTDTIAYESRAGVTASGFSNGTVSISTDQTTNTFTVTTTGAVSRGYYDFLYNGTRFPKAFFVA